ncbi:alpha/beta hydrolase [Bacteroidota bacterium]
MRILLTTIILLFTVTLKAQIEMNLWDGDIPYEIKNDDFNEEVREDNANRLIVGKVKVPTIKVYRPEASRNTGVAIVICPGGAYVVNAIGHEGYQVAEWLAENGITGVVLKYRLPDDAIMENKSMVPLTDAQQAIRVTRKNAKEWGIDQNKIGIMGFSAGGNLAATASTHYMIDAGNIGDTTSLRPDFSVLVYAVVSMGEFGHDYSRLRLLGENPTPDEITRFSNELWVDENTPPAFLVHSTDDTGVPVQNSLRYYEACVDHGVPASLHVFQTGGHGYGLRNAKGPEDDWNRLLLSWMKVMGFLE